MELTRERLTALIFIAIAIVAIGLYAFLYRPLIGKLRAGSLECREVETERRHAQEEIESLEAIEVKKVLITEEEVSLAIDELTRVGKSKGIDFVSIRPDKIEKADDAQCKILPVHMEIKSTYEELGAFLGSVDRLRKSLVAVKGFNISFDKEKMEKLNTKLVINMYLLGQ